VGRKAYLVNLFLLKDHGFGLGQLLGYGGGPGPLSG
jgi:hypothetical protein